MTYKIKNISKEPRKFRVHKTAEAFFIRPGEELIINNRLIIDRPDIFKVTDLEENTEEELRTSKKRTKHMEDKK